MNQPRQSNITLGQRGEQIAAVQIEAKGYRIVERNFRCKLGEIDLIATDKEYLIFIEVKTRTETNSDISPLLSITRSKQKKLKTLGTYYIAKNEIYHRQPRFDVIGIVLTSNGNHRIEYIENAF